MSHYGADVVSDEKCFWFLLAIAAFVFCAALSIPLGVYYEQGTEVLDDSVLDSQGQGDTRDNLAERHDRPEAATTRGCIPISTVCTGCSGATGETTE